MSGESFHPGASLSDDNFSANIGGVGVSVKTGILRGFFSWLGSLPASALLAIVVMMTINLSVTLLAGWYVSGYAVPMALGIINDGNAARDASHSKDLEKVIAAFKESNEQNQRLHDQNQKYNEKMIETLEKRLAPIAVNPLGGS